jgi:hypothetical protein
MKTSLLERVLLSVHEQVSAVMLAELRIDKRRRNSCLYGSEMLQAAVTSPREKYEVLKVKYLPQVL